MKKRLYTFFLRFFSKEIDESFRQIMDPYFDELHELKEENKKNKHYKRKYELVERIFWDYPSAKIIGIKKDKRGNEYFVVDARDTVYLYSWDCICFLPRLYYKVSKDKEGKECMKIVDVQMGTYDIGQGTIAMEALLKIAKEKNLHKVWGEMSFVDNDHKERRNHYYEKFGFTVSNIDAVLILEY